VTASTLAWTPWGLSGLIAGIMAWIAAVFIFRTAPDPRVRRRFSLLLFIEGVMILTGSSGPPLWIGSAEAVRLASLSHFTNDWLLLAVYLPAVAVAVDSPLLRPFRSGVGRWTLAAIGLGGALLTVLRSDLFIADVSLAPPNFGPVLLPTPGRAWPIVAVLLAASYTYGFVATLLSWRAATGPVARRRAGALSLAFGTRDVFWGGLFLGFGLFPASMPQLGLPLIQLASFALLVYVVVTAYGIASAHLFDIDLRLKWTLERGTVAAVFVAVFFVVSEGTATFLSDRLGSLLGLLVTGGLVFVLAPLHRASERLSGIALPHVTDTREYRAFRKEQIYGEALAEALKDGDVTPMERAILERLRSTLELDEEAARDLEAAVARPAASP
jgi:hypothetical protein